MGLEHFYADPIFTHQAALEGYCVGLEQEEVFYIHDTDLSWKATVWVWNGLLPSLRMSEHRLEGYCVGLERT